jgi:hypothetical protein
MRSTQFGDLSFEERRLPGPKPTKPVVPTHTLVPNNDQEQIRYRAYGLYVQNGYRDGYAVDDWLTAERQLRSQLNK